jgi:hypothetical protein
METKPVIVDFTISFIMDVPIDWGKDMIEFHYNESSWCCNNFIDKLNMWVEKTNDRCICPFTTAKYVSEATEEEVRKFWEPDTINNKGEYI